MSRFLLFFYSIALSTHSLASRNPYADQDDYGGPSFGIIFLFTLVPILLWVFAKFLQDKDKNDEVKRFEKEKKLREHTDRIVKEFAEKNKTQKGENKDNLPRMEIKPEPKPDTPKNLPFKVDPHVEEKTNPKKEFPKLTKKEREYALFRLGMDKFGIETIECHKCGRVDLLCNFDDSSAGNRFRYCNVCKSHFEIDLPGIEELEAKLINVFYLRCFGCEDVVKRVDLLDSSAGYSFKKCPSCRKYNFQTYGLSETWYEKNIYPESDQIKFDHHTNIRLALKAIREIKKEKHQLKIKKKEYRTTPHLRHSGWLKKPHKKNRYMNRRYSKVKWVVNWLIDREPRVFT